MPEHYTVAITRQIGSGGAYIGQEVAKHLGFSYVDREILRQVSRSLQEDENTVSDREERVSSFWEKLVQALSVCAPEAGYIPPPFHPLHDKVLFATEAMIIRNICERCNAVIVGRGGSHALRENRHMVSVFLHAPVEFRVHRIMQIYNITDHSYAETIVRESDIKRRKFHKAISDTEWTEATNYHLSINTGKIGFESAIETVVRLVQKMCLAD